jgi:hypothetical protein
MKMTQKQALIAEFKESLALCFLDRGGQFTEVKPPEWVFEIVDNRPIFYKVIDKTKRIVEFWDDADVLTAIHYLSIQAKEYELYFQRLGSEALLTLRQVSNALDYIKAVLSKEGGKQLAKIVPIADVTANNPNEYYLHRVDYPFFVSSDALAIKQGWEVNFGPFINSLREHFASPEMFDILCCFVARAVLEERYSEEFLFWYGEGGDGKGTLMSYLINFLGNQANVVQPADFDAQFGAASYAHLRLCVVDEFDRKFDLWSSKVKTLTGMGTIGVEKKGKDKFYVKNRLLMVFLANDRPKFKNVSSQQRRFRYIESLPRKNIVKQDRDELKAELDREFQGFLQYCCSLYVTKYNRRIPETNEDILEELAESRIEPVFNFIVSHFKYKPGAFLSKAAIDHVWPNRFPTSALDDALDVWAKKLGDGHSAPKSRRVINGQKLRGWNNVAFQSNVFGIQDALFLCINPEE